MATPIPFSGQTDELGAPKGREEDIGPLPVFRNGHCCVSCWQFSPEELAEIAADGGRVFLSVWFGKSQPPVYLGSEEAVRAVVADHGEVWRK